MPQFKVDQTALLKILLHSLKYPNTGVNGILLGQVTGSGNDSTIYISDCIPTCHSHITLTPILEAALTQVEAYTKQSTQKLQIMGYYQCNETLGDVDMSGIARRAADRIQSLYPSAVAVVLDGPALHKLLSGSGSAPVLRLYWKDGARGWSTAPPPGSGSGNVASSFECPTAGIAGLLKQYIEEGRQHNLVDFEYHLEDLSADWLNTTLTS